MQPAVHEKVQRDGLRRNQTDQKTPFLPFDIAFFYLLVRHCKTHSLVLLRFPGKPRRFPPGIGYSHIPGHVKTQTENEQLWFPIPRLPPC